MLVLYQIVVFCIKGIGYSPSAIKNGPKLNIFTMCNFVFVLFTGEVVKAACLKSRTSWARIPLWPSSFKETKCLLPTESRRFNIMGNLPDREVACSAPDHQGSNFESCVWRAVPSQHPQEVPLARFSL